jgi:tetratricopeptide (TPR) repeat protein
LATSKINSIKQKAYTDSLETAQKSNGCLIYKLMNSGNKALAEKSYDAARMLFTKALGIKPGDAMATSRLSAIDQQIAADNLQTERAATQALHDGYIKSGDEAFKNNLLDEARGDYSQALTIDPKDTHAKDQIKKIDALLEQSRLDAQKLLEAQQNAGT